MCSCFHPRLYTAALQSFGLTLQNRRRGKLSGLSCADEARTSFIYPRFSRGIPHYQTQPDNPSSPLIALSLSLFFLYHHLLDSNSCGLTLKHNHYDLSPTCSIIKFPISLTPTLTHLLTLECPLSSVPVTQQ